MSSCSDQPLIKSLCESCELQRRFIFRHINTEQLQFISNEIEVLHYMPGEFIFKKGASPRGFMCLKKGKVKITNSASNGNEQIIDLKSSPDTLGIRALSTKSRYRSSAIALDHVSICLIPTNVFQEILDTCPKVLKELLYYVGDRLIRADHKLISLTQKHIRSRLADTILLLQQTMGDDLDGYIDISLKRTEMAQLSNMTTPNVIRILSEFKRQGLIDLEGRKIRILNEENLTKISEFEKF